jgi:hypothetical protein
MLADKARKFIAELHQQMGAHVFMLVGYRDSEGDPVRTRYAYSSSS